MNIAPRYLGRGSWLARRDPRVLILVVALFIFTVLQVWDERVVLLLLAVAIVYYRSAGIEWRAIRRNWAFVFVFIGLLVSVNLFVFFWYESFFNRNIADIRPLFSWLPVLLVFLCSALTMRLWSEEQKLGTMEILFTLPVKTHHLVLGKFFASLGLVAVALALTLSVPITPGVTISSSWAEQSWEIESTEPIRRSRLVGLTIQTAVHRLAGAGFRQLRLSSTRQPWQRGTDFQARTCRRCSH